MEDKKVIEPDSSAVRVALWRAIHVQVDAPPRIFEDEVGLRLADPPPGWRDRPDMNPQWTSLFRASIVARARFIEDLVLEQTAQGVGQYVILGAGLDTFAQRRPEMGSKLRVFEIDKPGAQEWKKKRLTELGYGLSDFLRLVPVDFEAGESWLKKLNAAGFDLGKPSVVASTGVSMYLTRDAILSTLREISGLSSTTLAMTYILPTELSDPEELPGREIAEKGAKAAGTPFISFFTPEQARALALEAGFKEARTAAAATLAQRYFTGRTDDFHLPKSEEFLIATT